MLVPLLLASLAVLQVHAQDPADAALKGIRAVSVVVDPIAPAAGRLGVTTDIVRADVEGALKAAAIGASKADQGIQLTVTINAVPIETTRRSTSGVAYSVSVSVEEQATIGRTGEAARAATWRRAGIGVARPAQAKDAIRDQLREYLAAFVSAWKAANEPGKDEAASTK